MKVSKKSVEYFTALPSNPILVIDNAHVIIDINVYTYMSSDIILVYIVMYPRFLANLSEKFLQILQILHNLTILI